MPKIVLTTSASKKFAEELIKNKGYKLGKVVWKNFADGERYLHLLTKVTDKDVVVIGNTGPASDDLFDILLLIRAVKENGARSVLVMIPYFSYARSDHVKRSGEVIAGRLVADMLQVSGADDFVCVDLHSEKIMDFLGGHCRHVSVLPYLASKVKISDATNWVVVSPDAGGLARARMVAKSLGVARVIALPKKRSVSGKISFNKSDVRFVKGKNILIVDDLIATGKTLIGAVKMLKNVGKIVIVCAHLLKTKDEKKNLLWLRKAGCRMIVADDTAKARAMML